MRLRIDRVETSGLGKVFGQVVALRGVDLRFEAGECAVVVGPNGAGKSTLLAILSTLARPSSGTVLYGGKAASELGAELRGTIGLAAEEPHEYAELTGRENLLLRARLQRVDGAEGRVTGLVAALGLEGVAHRPMAGYSQGERRRLGLAGAFVHKPSLLLLDEPSSGLDGAGAARLVAQVREDLGRGAVVAMTTHDPWLAAEIGDRMIALRGGAVRADAGAPEGEEAWREILAEEGP